MAAALNVAHLIATDDPADYRRLPIIIGSNHRSGPIVQFQCRIGQRVGNVVWGKTKLRAYGANNYPL